MRTTKYVMTESDIEALAAEHAKSAGVADGYSSTYLRALIAGAQAQIGPKRGKPLAVEQQLAVLQTVAEPFYAAVLRGVTTADIAPDPGLDPDESLRRSRERNRRGVFARTAKSTIVSWVKAGGDLRLLDVATVTKGELRGMTAAARADQGSETVPTIQKAQQVILAAVARQAPEDARTQLEAVIEALQRKLDELGEDERPVGPVARVSAFREAPRVMNKAA